jgi:hypothetical protein
MVEIVRELRACKSRVSQLRVCLEYFQQRKSGDPFRGVEVLRQKRLLLSEPLAGPTP